jgi:hypothetical protein
MEFHPSSNNQKHIEATHPTITSNEMPPDHTLIIEATITSSQAKNSNQKNDKHLHHRITVHLTSIVHPQIEGEFTATSGGLTNLFYDCKD